MIVPLEAMMFKRFAAAVALAFALSSAAFAQSVAGGWDLTIIGPEGPINATATLKQDGENVTGSIETPQGTAEMKGTLKGKALNMSFSIAGPNGNLDIKVTSEVDGAAMKGIIDFGMGMAEFTAKKK
jgi:hypothetical protein